MFTGWIRGCISTAWSPLIIPPWVGSPYFFILQQHPDRVMVLLNTSLVWPQDLWGQQGLNKYISMWVIAVSFPSCPESKPCSNHRWGGFWELSPCAWWLHCWLLKEMLDFGKGLPKAGIYRRLESFNTLTSGLDLLSGQESVLLPAKAV